VSRPAELGAPSGPDASPGHSVWHNWITLAGAVLSAASLFAFVLLLALDLMGRGSGNPYLGILCYVLTPGFLLLGGAIAAGGAWHQRRLRRRDPSAPRPHFAIDLGRPRDRRRLLWFALGAASFLLVTAVGSYQTFVYSESDAFCGEVCHSVMGPENTAYHRTAHARVACVDCHVGSGASSYLEAKLNGTHQLYDLVTGRYPRPIPTPVLNLRPASQTCEQCHWPQKYSGSIERVAHRYLADPGNTPITTRLLVNVGGGDPAHGPVGGIHWHMNLANKVEYYATDRQRQVMPWVRITSAQGVVTTYRTAGYKGEPRADQIRRMDCLDCHNRPAHRFQTANDAVDEAMYLGRIDPKLPGIKRATVDWLTRTYPTQAAGATAVGRGLRAVYGAAPGGEAAAVAAVAIYRSNFFPEMKADAGQYPDNIGHLDSAGCFRCHDGKHLADGDAHRMPATDCDSCHTLLAQGSGAALATLAPAGVVFQHPGGDMSGTGLTCSDCHNGKNQAN